MWLKAASARRVRRLTAALALACAFWTVFGGASDAGSPFETITNKGDRASRTDPRSAIKNYYEPNLDSVDFASAAIPLQERFLYEYLQACNRAAERAPEHLPFLTTRYRKMAVTVATRYIVWFRRVEQGGLTNQLPVIRIETVVENLGSARILAGTRDDLIYDFEAIPLETAYYFNVESLKLWEGSLRLSLESIMTDQAIKARLRRDPEYAVHWKAFRTVLEQVAKGTGRSRGYAHGRLVMVEQLLSQSGL